MKSIFSIVLLISFSFFAAAQNNLQIKGKIIDSVENLKLANASISVLNAKDSTLVKFGWADNNGDYVINNLIIGKFILLVSYPTYADYVQQFTLDSTKNSRDFGTTNLFSKRLILSEVIIKGKVAALKMNGDTTEFNANAFVIQPNAKVEDLLKQLPGIQIDNNGKISAYGQEVKKVLVDGEEFFGNDPTLVTRNLRGDMIAKVQLYDKKSDPATFTGIDDGIKEKTINLKLKEDKKRGYFGKVETGIGTAEFYQAQGMANLFREKQKMAIYGNIGNTGLTGLSSSENSRYGTGGGTIGFVSGGVTLTGTNADEVESNSGRYSGQGIPLAKTSGAHYDGKWNEDKESINANVKIGSLQVDGERNTITQNDLPNGLILTNQKQDFSSQNFRKRIDANYQIKLSTTATFRVKMDGITKETETENNFLGSTLGSDLSLLNQSARKLTEKGTQQVLNVDAFYSKKLKKEGRTISWNLIGVINRDNSKGFLNAINDFYDVNGNPINTQTVNQYKINTIALNAYNSNLAFSEVFSKTFSVGLSYKLGLINSKADRKSFNPTVNGGYTILDKEYSNDFVVDQLSNQVGALFTYQKGKDRILFGGDLTTVDFKQVDRFDNLTYNRHFLNFNPRASYSFRSNPQSIFQVNYNGRTIQPAFTQIQPIKVNTDPLNVVVGNANLRPAFRHDILASFNTYKAITGLSVNFIASYDLTANPIVNSLSIDKKGISVNQFFNLKDENLQNIVLRGDLRKQIKSISGYVGWSFFFINTKDYGVINDEINKRESNSLTTNFDFSKTKQKKYDFLLGFGPRFFTGSSSLQNQLTNNGFGYDGYLNLSIYLPYKFEFRSNSTYNFQSKTESFREPYKALVINGAIGKKFMKDESLKLSISANDLLNQNVGFKRSSFGTMVTQSNFTNIARHFMFSLIWDFSKFGKTVAQ